VLFPLHPRTRKRVDEFGLAARLSGSVRLVEPLGYLDAIGLFDAARLVLTDSGGVQEETTALRVPCLTLRENTERPITLELGSSRLVGPRREAILAAAHDVLAGPLRCGAVPELWDGKAAERIAASLCAS
jgi:UDP-N-acetylglucosamine 2-epimerase (non-hydrolysing)